MVSVRRTSIAVRYLDRRQTSWALQANEGNFARLPGEPVGVVAQPCLGIFREEHGLAQPYPEPSHLPVHLDRRGSLGLVAGDQHFCKPPEWTSTSVTTGPTWPASPFRWSESAKPTVSPGWVMTFAA